MFRNLFFFCSMEHQAALESLLEVYEALRKAVRAQLDGTGSHAVHRGRADLQARAIREALQVLAAETSALEGGPQDGGRTPPPGEKETKLLQGHVQVFQALWEHILGEVVLCLGQADLPEVAGLLQCAQENHADFLKRVSWPAASPPSPPHQSEARESIGEEQIQILVMENQRLQKTIQELAAWGNPGPLEKLPPLVIPPTPATPGGSVEPGSFSPSPQNPTPRKSEALPPPLLFQRPRARTEDVVLLRGGSGVVKRPSPKTFIPPGNGNERAFADHDRQATVADGILPSEGLHRARTLGADVSDKHDDVSNRLQRSLSTRAGRDTDVSAAGPGGEARGSKGGRKSATAAALRASAEQMLGSFRRMLHTSGGSAVSSDLSGGEAVETTRKTALSSITRGNSWFGKEGNGRSRSRQEGAIGRTRSNTVGSRPSPRRTPPGRTTPRTTPPERLQHQVSLPRGASRQSLSNPVPPPEEGTSAASPRFGFSPPLSPIQADIPDGWERFAEVSIPSTPRGEAGIWSIAPTPTAARAAVIAATGGSAALLERWRSATLPLGEQPTNVSPGTKVPALIPGPFQSGKPVQIITPESAREDATGGAAQSASQPGFTPPGPGHSSSGNEFTPPRQESTGDAENILWEVTELTEDEPLDIPENNDHASANLEEGRSEEPAAVDRGHSPPPVDDISGATEGAYVDGDAGTEVLPCSERILALRDRLLGDPESLPKPNQSPRNRLSGRGVSSERHVSIDERENKDPLEGSSRREWTQNAKARGVLDRGKSGPQQKVAQGGGFVRRMSLKELKILIEEVYASKVNCLALQKQTQRWRASSRSSRLFVLLCQFSCNRGFCVLIILQARFPQIPRRITDWTSATSGVGFKSAL